ncbi:hypothetical protein D3C73_1260140 [compost metagenome]
MLRLRRNAHGASVFCHISDPFKTEARCFVITREMKRQKTDVDRFAAAKRSQALGQLRKLDPVRVPETDRHTNHRQLLLLAGRIKMLTRIRQGHPHNRVRHHIDVSLINAHIAEQSSRFGIPDRNILTATEY